MRKIKFLCPINIVLIATLSLVAVLGCGSAPEKTSEKTTEATASKKKEPAKKEFEFETGRSAFQRMYVSARTWAPDAQPVRMESKPNKEDPRDGRAGVWSAVFASAAKQNVRNYTWSGVSDDPNERGVSPGSMDYYSPANASTRPFDMGFLKVDTDKAFEVAQKKGGAALLKKEATTPVKYMLFFEAPKSRLVWRVVYGTSQNEAKLNILVNASTGEFTAIEK